MYKSLILNINILDNGNNTSSSEDVGNENL